MKSVALALCALAVLFCTVPSVSAWDYDEGVLVLGNDNFDDALKEFPNMLVEFYAPWCGHCKNLAPEYAGAAQELEGYTPQVKLAKVDATIHRSLGERYGVQGFPTLYWFVNGKESKYSGGRKTDKIVSWIKKKTGPAFTDITSDEEATAFLKKTESGPQAIAVGFFPEGDSANRNVFEEVARSSESEPEIPVCITTSASAFKILTGRDSTGASIAVVKNFDDKLNVFEGNLASAEEVSTFVDVSKIRDVLDIDGAGRGTFFGSPIPAKMMLMENGKNKDEEINKLYAEHAAEFKKKGVIFARLSGEADAGNSQITNYFGIKEADLPTFILMEQKPGSGIIKYRHDDVKTLDTFLLSYLNGEAEPMFKSEPVPEINDYPVTTLVGKNFKEIVFDNTKDVLVEFYAPWCGHCKNLAPTWDELGEAFKDNPNIVIAKVDATANESKEMSECNVRGFPTIKWFPANDKTPQEYDGGRKLEDFVKFIKEKNTVGLKEDL